MDIHQFFQHHRQALGLRLVAGGDGVGHSLHAMDQLLIAPHGHLSSDSLSHCKALVICNGHQPNDSLRRHCHEHSIPLMTASVGDVRVAQALAASLLDSSHGPADGHPEYSKIGTVVNVFGSGVLLSGPSGVGKSELALGLVDRGHALVVDDGPEFSVDDGNALVARCPAGFEGLLEVRGMGIVNVVQLYGEQALHASCKLALVVELGSFVAAAERIEPAQRSVFINTIELPLLELAASQGRNLALLVEVAVKRLQRAAKVGSLE